MMGAALKLAPEIKDYHSICTVNSDRAQCDLGAGCEWLCVEGHQYPYTDPLVNGSTCICYDPNCETGFVRPGLRGTV